MPRRAGPGAAPRAGPGPARLPAAHRRHPAHQLLPASTPTARHRPDADAQAGQRRRARAARPAPEGRDVRPRADGRGHPPAGRPDRPRRAALERTARRLPHRGARPGLRPGQEERHHRSHRRQGRLRLPAAWRPRPGRRRPAPTRCRAAYEAFVGALLDITDNLVAGEVVTRRGVVACDGARPVPGRGRRQGHGHLLRPGQRPQRRVPVLARGRLRLGRLARLRPQGDGHHRPGGLGRGPPPLPPARHRRPDRPDHGWSASATCPATCSATACCRAATIRLVAAFDHRHVFLDPDPDPAASFAERAPPGRPAPLELGRLRPGPASPPAGGSGPATPRPSRCAPGRPAGPRGRRPSR